MRGFQSEEKESFNRQNCTTLGWDPWEEEECLNSSVWEGSLMQKGGPALPSNAFCSQLLDTWILWQSALPRTELVFIMTFMQLSTWARAVYFLTCLSCSQWCPNLALLLSLREGRLPGHMAHPGRGLGLQRPEASTRRCRSPL